MLSIVSRFLSVVILIGNKSKMSRRGQGRFQKRPFKKYTGAKSYPSREYRHQDQLTESEVGISEFISDLEGFSGVIKARYSDFQVNEIDLNGQVAKLTNTKIPEEFRLKLVTFDYKSVEASPIEYISQEKWQAIKNILESKTPEPVEIEADNLTKSARTEIHQCIKAHFGQKIIASTIQKDELKFLQFKKFDKEEKQDVRTEWPKDKGEYVHFLVYKESLDTMEACMKIGDCLKISPSKFAYAGIKDRRAKTTQWFSAHKVEPWKLIMKTRDMRNIKIGNLTFLDKPLRLGQLEGNKFRVALRNVTGSDDLITQSMNNLKENGFINYYGLQRFGNDKEVPTFRIGVDLLLGNFKEAVQLILKPKESDDPIQDTTKAKKIYSDTGNAKLALNCLTRSKNKCVEAKLFEGLTNSGPNDYVNALENIPRNMRLLYIHAFQSLIWNMVVSKRLNTFGMKPVEGDLVLACEETVGSDETNVEEKEDVEQILPENEKSLDSETTDESEIKCKQKVKALTTDDLPIYTIYDIVLPLPGYDITYPENMKEYYKEAIEKYGLTLEMTKQTVKTYTLCGNYRKMFGRVLDLSWKIMYYDSPTDNLIQSDFEELRKMPEPKSIEGGQYKALVIEFNLKPACYATMVLREIMKSDTSSSAQAKLNDYCSKPKEKSKKIIDNATGELNQESEEVIKSDSLLADPQKFENFKNSIFSDIMEPVKRKIEEDIVESKKAKIEAIE